MIVFAVCCDGCCRPRPIVTAQDDDDDDVPLKRKSRSVDRGSGGGSTCEQSLSKVGDRSSDDDAINMDVSFAALDDDDDDDDDRNVNMDVNAMMSVLRAQRSASDP
jgi:hypothetical protein